MQLAIALTIRSFSHAIAITLAIRSCSIRLAFTAPIRSAAMWWQCTPTIRSAMQLAFTCPPFLPDRQVSAEAPRRCLTWFSQGRCIISLIR
jgi:hypothetical protein